LHSNWPLTHSLHQRKSYSDLFGSWDTSQEAATIVHALFWVENMFRVIWCHI
jgi:hypothetical protein